MTKIDTTSLCLNSIWTNRVETNYALHKKKKKKEGIPDYVKGNHLVFYSEDTYVFDIRVLRGGDEFIISLFGIYLEWSYDAVTWKKYGDENPLITFGGNKLLYLRGMNDSLFEARGKYIYSETYSTRIKFTPKEVKKNNGVYCFGNIMHLLDYEQTLDTIPVLENEYGLKYGGFYELFNNSALRKSPDLPAINLAPHCYEEMFEGCNLLETTPELNASTLAERCYYQMFQDSHKVNFVKMLGTNVTDHTNAYDALFDWLSGTQYGGTVVLKREVEEYIDNMYIPSSWKIEFVD